MEPQNQEIVRAENGRFVPGVSGCPGGGTKAQLSHSYNIKKFLLKFYQEQHIDTGKFENWVNKSTVNQEKFYHWVVGLLPKEMDLKGEGFGNETRVIIVKEKQSGTDSRGAAISETVSGQPS